MDAMAGGSIEHFAGIILAGWLNLALPAVAADEQTCARGTGDAGIDVCTREIQSGKYRGPALAQRYYNRGVLYSAKEDNGRAIPDLTEAIRLDSNDTKSLLWRGYVNSDLGNYDAAAADLGRVLLAADDAYAALWYFLANWRTGKQSAMALEVFASKLKPAQWPYPVVQLYLGRRTPDQVLAAADKPNELCEAQFYIGTWHALRGERVAASGPLKAAGETCPKWFAEYHGAQAELKRLGQ
jgi:lipoprotein NlpI